MTRSLSDVVKQLRQWIDSIDDGETEADTRRRVIDKVLSALLGWPEESIKCERMPDVGSRKYMDYYLEVEYTHCSLVVEAKRRGRIFELETTGSSRVRKLRDLRTAGKELQEGIEQAEGYCRRKGTQYYLLTNGEQWVGGNYFQIGVADSQRRVVVFESLHDVLEHIDEFRDFFSPSGIEHRNLADRCLPPAVSTPTFASSLCAAATYIPSAKKNYLSSEIGELMRVVMRTLYPNKLSPDWRFMKECYVTSANSEGNVKRLEPFVSDRLPSSIQGQSVPINRAKARSNIRGSRFGKAAFPSMGEVLLVVGAIGSGKSTFLEYWPVQSSNQAAR